MSDSFREPESVRGFSVRPLALYLIVLLSGCTSIQTKIQIDAPPTTVREVLLNFADYPVWNPFIVKVEGTVAPGNKVHVTVKPVGKDPLSGDTLVTSLSDTRLAWTGGLSFPGLFEGKHEFIVEDLGANKTMFYQNEKMSGIVILFANIKPEAEGFVLMNEELKKRAERTTQSAR